MLLISNDCYESVRSEFLALATVNGLLDGRQLHLAILCHFIRSKQKFTYMVKFCNRADAIGGFCHFRFPDLFLNHLHSSNVTLCLFMLSAERVPRRVPI